MLSVLRELLEKANQSIQIIPRRVLVCKSSALILKIITIRETNTGWALYIHHICKVVPGIVILMEVVGLIFHNVGAVFL